MDYEILVIGTSAGGIEALKVLFEHLTVPMGMPIFVIQHLQPGAHSYLPEILSRASGLKAFEAEDKMPVRDNCIYTPAPNYHMLFEKDYTISINVSERVSFARPSIDVTFESISDALKDRVIGVLLTGANHDGAKGLMTIQKNGGYTIVQEPKDAIAEEMPRAALKIMKPDDVLTIEEIAVRINELAAEAKRESDE